MFLLQLRNAFGLGVGGLFLPFHLNATETKIVVPFICRCYLCNNSSHKKRNQKSTVHSVLGSLTQVAQVQGALLPYWCCGERPVNMFHLAVCQRSTYRSERVRLSPTPWDYYYQLHLSLMALCFNSFLSKYIQLQLFYIVLWDQCQESTTDVTARIWPVVRKIQLPESMTDPMLCGTRSPVSVGVLCN